MTVAVITGASSGLGKEFLKQILEKYPMLDEVWIVARRVERLNELRSMDEKRVRPVPLDLLDYSSYEKLDSMLKEEKAEIRLFVNNAGFGSLGNVAEEDHTKLGKIVDLNCRALTSLSAVALRYMKKGSGIINVCSIASFCPNPRMTVYSSSKAYVNSFSQSLRFETKKDGINVLAVCPGPMETEFLSVAGITKQNSKTFATLPYCDPVKVVKNSLKACEKGRAVYTPRAFFKFYRFVSKLVPKSIMMHAAKT